MSARFSLVRRALPRSRPDADLAEAPLRARGGTRRRGDGAGRRRGGVPDSRGQQWNTAARAIAGAAARLDPPGCSRVPAQLDGLVPVRAEMAAPRRATATPHGSRALIGSRLSWASDSRPPDGASHEAAPREVGFSFCTGWSRHQRDAEWIEDETRPRFVALDGVLGEPGKDADDVVKGGARAGALDARCGGRSRGVRL